MQQRPLLVYAHSEVFRAVAELFSPKGYEVQHIDEALPPCDAPVALMVEVGDDARRGEELLRLAASVEPRPALLALCQTRHLASGVAALRRGADDFVVCPFDPEELEIKLHRAVEHVRERRELDRLASSPSSQEPPISIVGQSSAMRRIRRQLERVAQGAGPVLIRGEPGTGRSLVARALHAASARRGRPFVRVNCARFPEALLSSELFGHVQGAFTGAEPARRGRLEEAAGGSVLLRAIDAAPVSVQQGLLGVLRTGACRPVGGRDPIQVDARLLVTNSRDLDEVLVAGRFLPELLRELHATALDLPSLRERPEDVVPLAESFLADLDREDGVSRRVFSDEARERLSGSAWPGNVRQLRNAVERAALTVTGRPIEPGDLALDQAPGPRAGAPDRTNGRWVRLPPEGADHREVERELILQALDHAGWIQKDAARLLRMSRRQLNYRIQRLGITHPSWRRNRPRLADG